ncbi:MAG: cell division protein FtsA [Hyphomicrobiales bacterium]|nr:cell division protein FtsA [Hyphomicrobiales bacterium]MCY4032416.1 cell division protein FtsA [Hyphomicrobiales bacterium]MCY4038416.1 cell division protein FtsA [Hyphomicrobiales bacterium]
MGVIESIGGGLRRRAGSAEGSGLLGAIDIGSSNLSCVIARRDGDDGAWKVIGASRRVSAGIQAGRIVDMDAAEATIRACVDAAEQIAGARIRSLIVGFSCGAPQGRMVSLSTRLNGPVVRDEDVSWLLQQGCEQNQRAGRMFIHAIPCNFRIDDSETVRDPRGMFARTLHADIHVIDVKANVLQNLTACIQRCHLDVGRLVIASYASGLGVLSEDEIELGAICIDLGGGSSQISMFFGGALIYIDETHLGSQYITTDIARGIPTQVGQAERLKTLYGDVFNGSADAREMISCAKLGEEEEFEAHQISRASLVNIIRPRLEEIFETVQERLRQSSYYELVGRRIVLTGGGASLTGARELASQIFNTEVRVGMPSWINGLPKAMCGPDSTVVAGLLAHTRQASSTDIIANTGVTSAMKRITSWLRAGSN